MIGPEITPAEPTTRWWPPTSPADPVTTTDELCPSVRLFPPLPTPWVWLSSPSAAGPPGWGAPRPCRPRKPPAGQGRDAALLAKIRAVPAARLTWDDVQLASTIFAVKPGDGSAREQAASCQRVLGAGANIVNEYATKRYRSNLINWGMLPFQLNDARSPRPEVTSVPHVPEASRAICRYPCLCVGEEVSPSPSMLLTSNEQGSGRWVFDQLYKALNQLPGPASVTLRISPQ